MNEIIFIASGLLLCYIVLYIVALYLQDNSIADLFWGPAFILVSTLSYFLSSTGGVASTLVYVLVVGWGTRLFFSILAKKIPYRGEDARYKKWREEWIYVKIRSFFQVFMLQGLFVLLISTPIFLLLFSEDQNSVLSLTLLGGILSLFGLLYESRADGELAGFIQNKKKGEILTSGLRYFSRYPQYFGESMFWLGISIIASQVSVLSFIGYIVITILVRYVSGVPMLEERYEGNEDFEKYSKNTPIFIPNYLKIFSKD